MRLPALVLATSLLVIPATASQKGGGSPSPRILVSIPDDLVVLEGRELRFTASLIAPNLARTLRFQLINPLPGMEFQVTRRTQSRKEAEIYWLANLVGTWPLVFEGRDGQGKLRARLCCVARPWAGLVAVNMA
jgi:hypothetical protein